MAFDFLGDRDVVQSPGQDRPQITENGPNQHGEKRQQGQNADAGIAKMDPIVGHGQRQGRRHHRRHDPTQGVEQQQPPCPAADLRDSSFDFVRHRPVSSSVRSCKFVH